MLNIIPLVPLISLVHLSMIESPYSNHSFATDESVIQVYMDASWKSSGTWLSGVAFRGDTCIKSWITKENSNSSSQAKAHALSSWHPTQPFILVESVLLLLLLFSICSGSYTCNKETERASLNGSEHFSRFLLQYFVF